MSSYKISYVPFFNALAMALGAYYFFQFSWLEDLPVFKLFNIWGIFFDILGVILLSSFLSSSARLKQFIVERVSFEFIAFLLFFILGSLILSPYAAMYKQPSAKVLAIFQASLLGPFTVIWFLVEDFVSDPKVDSLKDYGFRLRVLGSTFLITGLTMQMIGAFLDIRG
ncbi:MAG: hypothetical protein GXP11_03550 [Gammaproteobacteria bacterium]|nr:hypothetical protein [Gammaproteobacteria bacterium]